MQRKWIKMSYALWLFNGMVLSWQLSRHGNFGYDTQWFTSTLIKTSWGELSHRVDRTWHSWIVKVPNIYIQHILSKLILCVPQCHTVKPSSEQNTLNDLVTLWCVYKTSISDLLRCLIIQVRVYLGESEQDMTPAPLFFCWHVLNHSDGSSALWWAPRHLLWRASQRQRTIYNLTAKGKQASS